MSDISCKECLKKFDCNIQSIRTKDNKYMIVECFSISFEGHIRLEGKIIAYMDDEGNIHSSIEEEASVIVCGLPLRGNIHEVNVLSKKFSSFHVS